MLAYILKIKLVGMRELLSGALPSEQKPLLVKVLDQPSSV